MRESILTVLVAPVPGGGGQGTFSELLSYLQPLAERGQLCYIRQAQAGPAAARNMGARAAQGEIVAFTDNDCLPEHDWIAKLVSGYDTEVVAIGGLIKNVVNDHWLTPFYLVQDERHRSPDEPLTYLDSANASFRRSVFLELGGFRETFTFPCAEDMDLGMRLLSAGHRLRLDRGAVVWHVNRTSLLDMIQQSIWRGLGEAYIMFEYDRDFLKHASQGMRLSVRRMLGHLIRVASGMPTSLRTLAFAILFSLRIAGFAFPQLEYYKDKIYPYKYEYCRSLALGWRRTYLCLALLWLDRILRLLGQVCGTLSYTYRQAKRGRLPSCL